jgi:putative hydroxymethylpyrimidine transport system permease protein
MAFFPVAVTTADALGRADAELVRLMRSLGVGGGRILWEVRLPSALPAIFSGLRLAAAYAVVGAVVAEWGGSDAGLGYTILQASSQFATAQSFAAIAVSCLMGIALFGLVGAAERLLVPWAAPPALASPDRVFASRPLEGEMSS